MHKRRTFGNMLSSQAMCFNVFAPLGSDAEGRSLLSRALRPFVPDVQAIGKLCFEYTPAAGIFGDQSAIAGVDCDLLVEYTTTDGEAGLLAIETKFVEKEFSRCAFRKKRQCPDTVCLGNDCAGCAYTRKEYRYWQRATELGTLNRRAMPPQGCPFGDALWQLWTSWTRELVHLEIQCAC